MNRTAKTEYTDGHTAEVEQQYRELMLNRETVQILSVCYYMKYLSSQPDPDEGMTQRKIAALMNLSASTVSRCVKKGQSRGWLKMNYQLEVPPGFRKYLPCYISVPHLCTQIKNRIGLDDRYHRITVVPGIEYYRTISGGRQADTNEIQELKANRDLVARAAAVQLGDKLAEPVSDGNSGASPHITVISWGETMNRLAESVFLSPAKQESAAQYSRIFPVIGNFTVVPEPDLSAAGHSNFSPEQQAHARMIAETYKKSVKHSSNTNARTLARSMGLLPPRALMSVAVVQTSRDRLEQCAPVFKADRTLVELYGDRFYEDIPPREGKIWEAHTFLTSVDVQSHLPEARQGVQGDENAVWGTSYEALGLVAPGIGQDRLKTVQGDIAGITFDDRGEYVDLGYPIIGPRLEHIRDISRRHRERIDAGRSSGAGVVIVAADPRKAYPIFLLLKYDLIDCLIIDEPTASAIIACADKDRQAPSSAPL